MGEPMEPLAGISHEDLLKVVLSFALLLAAARLFGELARRLDLPEVVGEISAGIVLGPSLLSGLFPAFGRLLLPTSAVQSQLLDVVALIGVMFLLIVVGLETDLSLIRTRARTATAVGLMGLIVPFAAGIAVSAAFPDELLVNPARRGVFSLFLAVSLALSAIPVLAKILNDLGLIRSSFGQTALAAGMLDDILGWALLGVVTSLAAAGGVSAMNLVSTIGGLALFLAATAFVAHPLVKWGLHQVRDRLTIRDASFSFLIVATFLWGAFSHALHLEPILGAFAMAVVFGRLRQLPIEVGRRVESMTFAVFAPVFLALAGLRLSLPSIWRRDLIVLTALLVFVAAASKIVGAFVGARFFAGVEARESLAYGVALNARGVLGIVVASIGLSMGILSVEVYSMIVVVSIVTSLVTPLGLRALLSRSSEAALESSDSVRSIRRVLMAVRPARDGDAELTRATRSMEANVLNSLGSRSPEVTLLSVARPEAKVHSQLEDLASMFPADVEVLTRVKDGDPSAVIVTEAAKHYDLVVMGAPLSDSSEHLFGSVVDDVVRMAPCPSLVFKARDGSWPPRTVMVPTGGSIASERAAQLAFDVADGATVVIYHVVDREMSTDLSTARPAAVADRMDVAQGIVERLRAIGIAAGVETSVEVEMGSEALTSMILARASRGIDLIVLGTSLRVGSPRLFLGPKVERLLDEAPCSVIVLNS